MAPVPLMPETNSTSRPSTALEETVPRPDMILGDLADLLVVEGLPQAGVVLAQRQHDHGRLLRSAQPRGVVDAGTFGEGHQLSCSQLRRIATDSSGWRSTNSETRLTEDTFTWPSIRAMSMRSSGPGRASWPPS